MFFVWERAPAGTALSVVTRALRADRPGSAVVLAFGVSPLGVFAFGL
jgi:hypothetical protein